MRKNDFHNQKEADAYDKMLDLADNLSEWLSQAPLSLEEEQREALSFFLAENKEALGQILRGSTPVVAVDGPQKVQSEKILLRRKVNLKKIKPLNLLTFGRK